ncbi:hypothetical protein ACFPRL_33355 [Pseudoclavibacter helvolus]
MRQATTRQHGCRPSSRRPRTWCRPRRPQGCQARIPCRARGHPSAFRQPRRRARLPRRRQRPGSCGLQRCEGRSPGQQEPPRASAQPSCPTSSRCPKRRP